MRAGRNQYAPMQGVARLRERIAAKVADLCGTPVYLSIKTTDYRVDWDEVNDAKKDQTLEQAAEILCRI